MSFALNRDELCRARNYRIRPLGVLYPPGFPGHDEDHSHWQHYDFEAAKRELALAGYPDGLPNEHQLWVSEGEGAAVYGQLIQADLGRIGIRLRIRTSSFAVFLETTQRRGASELSLGAWSQDLPRPQNFAETLFHSRSILPENSQNQAFYSNPQLYVLLIMPAQRQTFQNV